MRRYCGWLLLLALSGGALAGWDRGRSFHRSRATISYPWAVAPRGGADEAQQHEDVISSEEGPQKEASVDVLTPAEVGETKETSEVSVLIEDDDDEEVVEGEVEEDEVTTLAREQAQEGRQKGKDLHDEGAWEEAAVTFYNASVLLEKHPALLEEYATCRLHEALCRLKIQDYAACVEACTAVLEREPPAAIRARALHRRSRAKLGLGQEEEALQDARSAAFLGDRKAVALYGKLMRQSSGESSSSLQDLFQGGNPLLSSADSSSSSSSALLESLLNKSPSNESPSNPMSMFMNGNQNGGGGGGLAKSVLASLTKQVENESTQEKICRYLQNTNEAQIQQLATIAGVPLSEGHASRLVSFCHGITPKGIRRSVKTTKRMWYGFSLVRKVSQILSKYRFVLILWVLLSWIKSALQRPIPINKRAARQAMKQALKQGAV